MFEKIRNNFPKSPEDMEGREDFQRYRKWLHLDGYSLEGKTILDVGSANAQFGEYVEKNFPGTSVIRFDYLVRKKAQDEPTRIDFRAHADQLPLRQKSIDMALAHASISNNSGEEMLAAMKEIFVTIKVGGEMRIAPVWDASPEFAQNRLRLAREYAETLENNGLAQVEWIDDGLQEIGVSKSGEPIKDRRYCLIIKKIADSGSNAVH